ncbi:MAG TPA: trypsin-like peptidase domain-containing protein [Nocardioides sp.]|nr:trypsin-like peptidase domain-containing protein [Nocardioides sp.]
MSDEQNPAEETQPILPEPAQESSPWAPPAAGARPLTPPVGAAEVAPAPPVPEDAPVVAPPVPEQPPAAVPPAPPSPTRYLTVGGGFPPPPDRPRRRTPGWAWPAVALVALLVGLLGGVGGAALYHHFSSQGGQVSAGLDGVDLATDPPLPKGGSVAAVAAAVLPSTVQIVAEYGGEDDGATGSGFVLDTQGHVITNNHVIRAAAVDNGPITVIYQDGKRYPAKIVGRSTVYDLAVLYVKDAPKEKPAALGASKAMRVGDPVVAIGSPLGLDATVTSGIVSALHRPVQTGESATDQSFIDAIQTDAAINPGNSGGPLVNMRGQVIGINSAIATSGGTGTTSGQAGNIGLGFAIPVEQVRVTADQILRNGKAQYPFMGVKPTVEKGLNLDGVTVDTVDAGTGAADAGLKPGDRITSINGQPVTNNISLYVLVRTFQPGDTVKVTYQRGGAERTADVTLGGKVG